MPNLGQILKLNRDVLFVDAVFRVAEGTTSASEVAIILRQAESKYDIRFLTAKLFGEFPDLPEELYAIAESSIYNLLTETEMVFGSYEYNRLDVVYQGCVGLWSSRSWGAMISKWANQANWLGKSDWCYLDFYSGLNDVVVQNYLVWSDALMKVIEQKSAEDVIERGR